MLHLNRETIPAPNQDHPDWHRGRHDYSLWLIRIEDEKIKNKVSAAREHLSGFLLNSAPFLEVHDREGSLERIRGVLSANGQEIGRSTYTPHVTIGLYAGSFPNGIVSSKIAAFPKETCMFTVDRITFARYRAQETAGALTYQHDVSLRTM